MYALKKLRKILIVANLILVPLVAAVPDDFSKIVGALAVGFNAGANYLIKEED